MVPKNILDEIKDCEDSQDLWRKIVHYHENSKKVEEVLEQEAQIEKEKIEEEVEGIEENLEFPQVEEVEINQSLIIEKVSEGIRSSSLDESSGEPSTSSCNENKSKQGGDVSLEEPSTTST